MDTDTYPREVENLVGNYKMYADTNKNLVSSSKGTTISKEEVSKEENARAAARRL